jgi:hypothetical protein
MCRSTWRGKAEDWSKLDNVERDRREYDDDEMKGERRN